jgi:SAM-dependent methyltransferase
MFLPEIPKAVAEIVRVLKPGGWVAAAVWSVPEKNPSLSVAMGAIRQVIELPPPDPTAPGIFRLAKQGELAELFQRSGLTEVTDHEFSGEWSYASPDEYYTSLMEIAAPIQNLMAHLAEAQKQEVKRLIVQAASQFVRGGRVTFPFVAKIVTGRKSL